MIPLSFIIFIVSDRHTAELCAEQNKIRQRDIHDGIEPQSRAKFSGLKNDKLTIRTHIYASILAAVGGLIMLANYNSAKGGLRFGVYVAVHTYCCAGRR